MTARNYFSNTRDLLGLALDQLTSVERMWPKDYIKDVHIHKPLNEALEFIADAQDELERYPYGNMDKYTDAMAELREDIYTFRQNLEAGFVGMPLTKTKEFIKRLDAIKQGVM